MFGHQWRRRSLRLGLSLVVGAILVWGLAAGGGWLAAPQETTLLELGRQHYAHQRFGAAITAWAEAVEQGDPLSGCWL